MSTYAVLWYSALICVVCKHAVINLLSAL